MFENCQQYKMLPKLQSCIWLHAASVGEINAMKPFLLRLIKAYPENNIVVSAVTNTGLRTAQNIHPDIIALLFPLDNGRHLSKFYEQLNPTLILIAETEFWPNFLMQAKLRKIPVLMINGRISEKSMTSYSRLKWLLQFPWSAIELVLAQSFHDKVRFVELGFKPVKNAKNLKFSVDLPHFNSIFVREDWGIKEDDFILTFGSTRPGEEAIILSHLHQLNKVIPNLKLILVPRHLERLDEIKMQLKQYDYCLFSENFATSSICLVDTMGILVQAYAISDLVIIGGSFFHYGGHNPLEPAYYSKPIIMGEDFKDCKASVAELKKQKAIQITNKRELFKTISMMVSQPDKMTEMGLAAKQVLEMNKDSLDTHFDEVAKWIK